MSASAYGNVRPESFDCIEKIRKNRGSLKQIKCKCIHLPTVQKETKNLKNSSKNGPKNGSKMVKTNIPQNGPKATPGSMLYPMRLFPRPAWVLIWTPCRFLMFFVHGRPPRAAGFAGKNIGRESLPRAAGVCWVETRNRITRGVCWVEHSNLVPRLFPLATSNLVF